MNTDHLLKPTVELKNAAEKAIESRIRFQTLQQRLSEQRSVANDVSERLRELVEERLWDRAITPEEASEARYQCSLLADQCREEQALLEAIEVALINSEDEILTARKDAFRIMRQDLDSFLGQPEVVHAA